MALAGVLAAGEASAIGWGRAPQSAVLGQVLDFPVTLRLDPGDIIEPRCVSAEVLIGDQRLPPPAVRVGVDNPNPETLAIRVLTDRVVDEPVVTVQVAVGCPTRMSRRFVLLADPPSLAAAPLPMLATAATVAAMPPVTVAAGEAAAPPRATAAAPAPAAESPPVRRAPPPPRKPRKPAPAPAEAPVARLKLDDAAPVGKVDPAAAAASATESAVAEAFQAVAAAASAARAAASAASAAEARIATLEQTVSQLRVEANANRDTIAQLRTRLAQADRGGRWTLPLLVAVVGLLALAVWMALRMRRLDAERVRAWRAAAAAQNERPATPTSQLPMVTTEIPVPPTLPPSPPSPPYPSRPAVVGAPAPLVAPPPDDRDLDIALDTTDVLPVGSVADPGSPRDVTIEELLDLEQQAEFFIVLGQDDAAVDLLVHHLRDTGGGSPLPYLKLLEIYRRRGEREAYERTRARFNHRFNAYAPEWEADLLTGRSLEAYPGVIPRLQQVWPRPMDAMAELEALLFRKSRGDLFDLPAYREVLFLYSLARDLLDREAADTGNVDLLLPLADGGEFSSTSPHPYLQVERDSVFDPGLPVDRPTAPVDLDLSQPGEGGPDSIVQPLNPKG